MQFPFSFFVSSSFFTLRERILQTSNIKFSRKKEEESFIKLICKMHYLYVYVHRLTRNKVEKEVNQSIEHWCRNMEASVVSVLFVASAILSISSSHFSFYL